MLFQLYKAVKLNQITQSFVVFLHFIQNGFLFD